MKDAAKVLAWAVVTVLMGGLAWKWSRYPETREDVDREFALQEKRRREAERGRKRSSALKRLVAVMRAGEIERIRRRG